MALRLTSSAVALRTSTRQVARAPVHLGASRPARVVHARASNEGKSEGADFDAYLIKATEAWEKSDNKPAVAGYAAAALGAFFFSEWLIHLPGLDILLGFPVQLVGLLTLPFLVLRWYVDGKDATADIGDVVSAITKKLPGLDGKK